MDRDELEEIARRGWNAVAKQYAEKLFHELERKPYDSGLLDRFASLVKTDLPVLDLGCGPGHVTAYLAKLGLKMHGIDLAPEMIRTAIELNPDLSFEVGNMLELELPPNSIGGAVAFYSLINLVREDVPVFLERLRRGLPKGAPVVIGVHHGEGELVEKEVLGVEVEMVGTLFSREELAGYAEQAGFKVEWSDRRDPYADEYPTQRVYLLLSA